MNDRALMTIQERIDKMQNSTAYSPADAAKRVVSIANAPAEVFSAPRNVPRAYAPDGAAYGGRCAEIKAEAEENLSREDKSPYKSKYGNAVSDKIILLADALAALPDRFKDEKAKPPAYYDLKMTLGDYLDALIDLSFREDGSADNARAERYRRLKSELSESYELSRPLCEAVAEILGEYREPRAELYRASNIIACGESARYYEQEEEMQSDFDVYEEYDYDEEYDDTPLDYDGGSVEVDEEALDELPETESIAPAAFVMDEEYCSNSDVDFDAIAEQNSEEQLIKADPRGYYLEKARELPRYLFKFNAVECLLLCKDDHSPEALRARADEAELFPEFRELFDELVTEDSISEAFKRFDSVTSKLCRLLIEPFAELGKYHFERHLSGAA